MAYDITFAPQLPLWLIVALLAATLIPVLWGLIKQLRGSFIRAMAWGLLTLALLNPSLLIEDREALKSIIALVVDQTGSQKIDGRDHQTETARKIITERLAALENFEVREIASSDQISTTTDVSTALFTALQAGLKDIPGDRLAGALMITDGRVHDIPQDIADLAINAPIHALITGRENEKDRWIKITQAPRYGVVGENYEISYEILQEGISDNQEVAVSIYIDGELIKVEAAHPGKIFTFADKVRHGGKNIIELRAETHSDELIDTNNRVFTTLNGIRENLRVLLVSGEPHVGERTWRNLLKSDASVDLVHFTILRPPEKQDGTPINQLSLIAFPTRELFVEKIDEFDLIIFDRYSRRGVLPVLYFDNIARYVKDGGAILVAAGPEYGVAGSIASTPLSKVLPALPNGKIREGAFKPLISELGQKHPVTRNLDGGKSKDPDWSHWFHTVSVEPPVGKTVMQGAEGAPLLVLSRNEKGRVALLLSDHAWLWARGYEGGGPHVQLLRHIAHWLMKEPDLEEERLAAQSNGNKINIERQTLGDAPEAAILRSPTGQQLTIPFKPSASGIYTAEVEVPEIGLYQIKNGELSTLTNVGPANPREFSEITSTSQLLSPIIEKSGGSVRRIGKDGDILPRILPVRTGTAASGNGWIGFKNTGASVLKGIDRISLFSGLLGLVLLLFAFAAVWTREGR